MYKLQYMRKLALFHIQEVLAHGPIILNVSWFNLSKIRKSYKAIISINSAFNIGHWVFWNLVSWILRCLVMDFSVGFFVFIINFEEIFGRDFTSRRKVSIKGCKAPSHKYFQSCFTSYLCSQSDIEHPTFYDPDL